MSKRKILVDCLYDQHMLLDRELFDVEEINSKAAIFTPTPEKNTYYMFHNVGWQETTGVKVCKFLENVQKLYSNNVAEGIKNKYPNAPLLEFAEESEMSTRRAMVDKS